jgi:peptidase YpeB-like protein
VNELFAMAVWAVFFLRTAAHIAFRAQRAKLAPVMRTIRQGIVPVAILVLGVAPFAQARCIPDAAPGGAGVSERVEWAAVLRDGISLDEAVRRAEAQYRAKVVRTDVQDEDGRTVYVLKLLSEDGRVITVRIDAATGRMR